MRSASISSEEFYVISDTTHNGINYSSLILANGNIYNYDSEKSVLFAKYNLSKTTGLQTSSASYTNYAGFSSVKYWDPNGSGTINSIYGTYANNANNIYMIERFMM